MAEHYNIRMADMHLRPPGARRRAAAPGGDVPGQAADLALAARDRPQRFGGRDHTTVMHAVRKIEELTAEDRAIAEDVEALKRMLQG